MSDEARLLMALRDASRRVTEFGSTTEIEETVGRIVVHAVETVDAAVGGGISRTSEGTVHSAFATDEDVKRLDHLQSDLHQGPCITASERAPESGIVVAHDLRVGPDRDRWPSFAPQAAALGFRSLMSLQLSNVQGHRSALNLYGKRPHAFDETAQVTASLFSVQAAVLLYGAEDANPGRGAAATRDVLARAEGVLIQRFAVGHDEAFRMLVSASRDTDIKLVDVARWVLDDAQRGSDSQKGAERETWGDERRRVGASRTPRPPGAAAAVTRSMGVREAG